MEITRREFMDLGGKAMLGAAVAPNFLNFLDAPCGFIEDILASPRIKKIHKYIEDHKTEHIARIQSDLRQPSVSSWNKGITEMAERMKESFKQLGCKEAELIKTDGLPGVWGWYDSGAKKTISHYMMYDTQPFDEKEWSSAPLAANLVKMDPFPQVIIARGAINDKGPNRAFLNACEAIIALEGKLPLNIMIMFEFFK